MTVDVPSKARRYWLLTMPRTASNMLIQVLNLDAQGVRPAHNGGYFFFPSMARKLGLYDRPQQEWTAEERAGVEESVRVSFDALQGYLSAAEDEGQRIFVKEHISFLNDAFYEDRFTYGPGQQHDIDEHDSGYSDGMPSPSPSILSARGFPCATRSPLNMTCLPDEFLQTWYPTFLIRHPAVMLPSLYRTAQKDIVLGGSGRVTKEPYPVEATLDFVRALYDFYAEHFSKNKTKSNDNDNNPWPVVLDADDIIASPGLIMRYATLVGLDPDKLRFEWERADEARLQKLRPAERVMLDSFNASTGVDMAKLRLVRDIDIDAEAVRWRTEFGPLGGQKLERWVRDAMPNYEYLRARRLTL